MKRRTDIEAVEQKCGRIDDAMRRYGVGRDTMRQLAKAAAAEIRIGRTYLVNYDRVDKYLDACSQ